ncbi:cupin domain-containing protein [Chondromyces apiculatus]|uniref:Cupin 2, conserved barrel domain protein n=1 Tax=Chondromyces apiculatus DSM 436 TaxID=1192034 RepID=A0A017SV35_9BACT|nr:cupin domain-containing protein [Chondromyces apiculatus]EYF00839.1 Cupin 2, conserved barrel domain protein [Chondromyces apiculatus DSM 436]
MHTLLNIAFLLTAVASTACASTAQPPVAPDCPSTPSAISPASAADAADAAAAPAPDSPAAVSAPSTGSAPAASVQTLMAHPFTPPPQAEGRMLIVDFPPGSINAAHHHDGAIFAYVLEGTVISALDDGPEVTYAQGKTWHEKPGQIHRVSRNGSTTERARLLVVYVTSPGAPIATPEK